MTASSDAVPDISSPGNGRWTSIILVLLFLFALSFGRSEVIAATCSGNADAVTSQTGVANPNNARFAPDGAAAELDDNGDQIVLDLTDDLLSGATYTIRWRQGSGTSSNASITVEESQDGASFSAATGSPFTVSGYSYYNQNVTASTTSRYLRLTATNVHDTDLDAISYSNVSCAGEIGDTAYDWGDLPDADSASNPSGPEYNTDSLGTSGPSHEIVADLR